MGSRPSKARSWLLQVLVSLGLAGILALTCMILVAAQYMYGSRHSKADHRPDALHMPYEQVSFPSAKDGVSLAGWLIPAQEQGNVGGQAAIVITHGHHQNMGRNGRENYLKYVAKPLHQAGFHVLLLDLRNHGMSQDAKPMTLGFFESRDVLGAIDWLQQHPSLWRGKPVRIGLWGSSMGAVTTLYALATLDTKSQPGLSVLGAWLDSPFARADAPIRIRLTRDGVPLMLQELLLALTPWLGPIDYRKITPVHLMEQAARVPLYFIHASQDDVIAPQDSRLLFEQAKKAHPEQAHELHYSAAQHHVGAAEKDPDGYAAQLVTFFTKLVQLRLGSAQVGQLQERSDNTGLATTISNQPMVKSATP